jgi:hypothetical protein
MCVLLHIPAPGRIALGALLIIGAVKVAAQAPWDLAFYRVKTPATQIELRDYAAKGRPNELISVQPDDEFYTLLLPLPGVRYCWIDPSHFAERYAPHLARLGYVMTARRFIDLPRSANAVPTAIMAASMDEIPAVIASRPESDFYVPAEFARSHDFPTHQVQLSSATRAFLLARRAPAVPRPRFLPLLPREPW